MLFELKENVQEVTSQNKSDFMVQCGDMVYIIYMYEYGNICFQKKKKNENWENRKITFFLYMYSNIRGKVKL